MPETPEDMTYRLKAMVEPGQQTWDLSDNDVAAIRWMLDENERLARERAAFLDSVVFPEMEEADDAPEDDPNLGLIPTGRWCALDSDGPYAVFDTRDAAMTYVIGQYGPAPASPAPDAHNP